MALMLFLAAASAAEPPRVPPLDLADGIALLIALLAAVAAAAGALFASKSASEARNSNQHSREANELSTKAIEMSAHANQISLQGNELTRKNAESIREMELLRSQLRAFEDARKELVASVVRFEDGSNLLQSLEGNRSSALQEEEVFSQARAVGRSLRQALREYGASRTIYRTIRHQLRTDDAARLEEQMCSAAKDFLGQRDAISAMVSSYGSVLEELERVAHETLGTLRSRLAKLPTEQLERIQADDGASGPDGVNCD